MKKSDFTKEQIDRIVLKAKTDLFFMSKDILLKDFTEGTHRAMCDFYVKKDPSFKTFKEFALAYDGPHDRMQLVPRLTYKSSIKVIDNAQWIVTFPEVRVLTVTNTADLSGAFIDELTTYFTVRGNAERDENGLLHGGYPTFFQEIFWEHCVTEDESKASEFITPFRKTLPPNLIYKEPTAGALSITGSGSGWRCDILDLDDVISDRNAESGSQLEKLGNRMGMITELRMNFGFRHVVGTRYHPQDPYGLLMDEHNIKIHYGDIESEGLKYMCRPCWWLKDKPYEQPDYKSWNPKEEDVDLFFPEGSPFKELKKKFKKPLVFFSQQLNAPMEAQGLSFGEDMVRSCFLDHTALPKRGQIFIAWDFAYSQKEYRDYSVGAVGLLDEKGEWWIIDIIRGRFNFSEKCHQVVNAIRQHRPKRTCLENSQGAQDGMTEMLDRQAKVYNVPLTLDWIQHGRGVADEKYLRMTALHPWIRERRIHFLNTISCSDDVIKEFVNIGNKSAKNDIPDAIAHLVTQFTRYADQVRTLRPEDDDKAWKEMEEREFRQMIFQRGKYEPVELPPAPEPEDIDPMTGLPGNPFNW